MKPDDQLPQHSEVVMCEPSLEAPRKPQESCSIFGDTACGEPLFAQHLRIDFTPLDDLDNDFVQRKVCAFWDFLQSRTDLHRLMVLPEKNLNDNDPSIILEPSSLDVVVEEPELKEITAVSILEFVDGKGLIDRTFEAKLPQSMCSLGSREYLENENTVHSKPKEACKCIVECKSCKKRSPVPTSLPDVQVLCSKMQEWDENHPKSMEPPGHPPPLSHCVLQRKIVL